MDGYELIRSRRRTAALEVTRDGRVLVRASGTEPLVRVMIEGPDQHEMDQDVYALAKLIEKKLNG